MHASQLDRVVLKMADMYSFNNRHSGFTGTYGSALIQHPTRYVLCLGQQAIQSSGLRFFLPCSSLIIPRVSDILFCSLVSRFIPAEHSSLVDLTERRSRTGRKGPYAGYYVQIQPGASFVGTSSLTLMILIRCSEVLHFVCPTRDI